MDILVEGILGKNKRVIAQTISKIDNDGTIVSISIILVSDLETIFCAITIISYSSMAIPHDFIEARILSDRFCPALISSLMAIGMIDNNQINPEY